MPNERLIRQWQSKEGLLLPDELVAKLPLLPRGHAKRKHWELKGYALERLAARIRLLPYRLSVLVVDFSNGWAAYRLAQLEKTKVLGINCIAANHEQSLRVFGEDGNPTLEAADIMVDAINPSTFDLVILNGVVEFYPDVGALLGQAMEYLKPEGEVQVVGSPFFELDEMDRARAKKWKEFDEMLIPQMKEHYFFHSVEEMTALGGHLLYNPYNRSGNLKNRVLRGKDSPDPWWMLPRSLIGD